MWTQYFWNLIVSHIVISSQVELGRSAATDRYPTTKRCSCSTRDGLQADMKYSPMNKSGQIIQPDQCDAESRPFEEIETLKLEFGILSPDSGPKLASAVWWYALWCWWVRWHFWILPKVIRKHGTSLWSSPGSDGFMYYSVSVKRTLVSIMYMKQLRTLPRSALFENGYLQHSAWSGTDTVD